MMCDCSLSASRDFSTAVTAKHEWLLMMLPLVLGQHYMQQAAGYRQRLLLYCLCCLAAHTVPRTCAVVAHNHNTAVHTAADSSTLGPDHQLSQKSAAADPSKGRLL
jgi:hypothetical protein